MKASMKLLALMAALAAGTAAAAGTVAGAQIKNTATASFEDPAGTAGNTNGSATSNEVTTTVLPKQGFDINYAASPSADTDSTDTVGGAAADYKKTDIKPEQWVAFEYSAVNNGNDTQIITLSTDVDGVDPATVKYFSGALVLDPVTGAVTGATELPKVSGSYQIQNLLPQDATHTGVQTFWMVYRVPKANPGTTVGATPIGTAQVWDGSANVSATEQKDTGGSAYNDLFWQYNSATIVTPSVDTTPKTPTTSTVTPPTETTPVPGYPDPSGTAVKVLGDEQVAYPKADTNTLNDTVVFTNTVTNGGTLPDTVILSVVSGGGNQSVQANLDGTYTITQTNADGSITTATVTISTPSVSLAVNDSKDYMVAVVYTDPGTANAYPVTVRIGVDSGNDNDTTPDAGGYTTDTILPPSMGFNDNGTSLTVDDVVTKADDPGQTVSFPMDVVNSGEYVDTYKLSGYVLVTLTDGSDIVVPVTYTGTGITQTGAVTVTIGGTDYSVPVYSTGTVAANGTLAVGAEVEIPTGALAGTYTVKQTATATYSGIEVQDNNDALKAEVYFDPSTSGVAVGKFVYDGSGPKEIEVNGVMTPEDYTAESTEVLPFETLQYRIIAKNNYNTTVRNFVLNDVMPANTTFVSAAVTASSITTAKVVYQTSASEGWSLTVPTTLSSVYAVAVDVNGDGSITAADVLPSGEQVTLDLTVRVK